MKIRSKYFGVVICIVLVVGVYLLFKTDYRDSTYKIPYKESQVSSIIFYNGFDNKSKLVQLDKDINKIFEFFNMLQISKKRFPKDASGTYSYRLTFIMKDGSQHMISYLDCGVPCQIVTSETEITVIPNDVDIYNLWDGVGSIIE